MNHLDEIDYLRQGIGLRGYGQRDPLIEYKREAFDLFLGLMDTVRKTYLMTIMKIEQRTDSFTEEKPREMQFRGASENIESFATLKGEAVAGGGSTQSGEAAKQAPIVNQEVTGRNDPCPCGSGLKYKRCGMINAPEHKK
jgi:preprotein translocase subunit SecA